MQGRQRNDYPCVRKKSVPDLMNSPVIRCRQSIIVRCQLLAAFLTFVQRESAVPTVAPELLQVEETVSHFRAFFNPTNQQVAFDEVDVAKWLATWVVYLLCIDWIEPLTQIHRAVSHEMLPQTIRHWLIQCCDAPCGCTSIMSVIRDLETRLLPIQSAHTLIANNAVDIIPGPGVCHAGAPDALDETVAPSVLEAKCSGDDAD